MKKRESFNSRWGFILACIGSAVGMGNIWMFPTRVSLYGGGSFLIPYFLFVALIGFTGVSGEMSFGRATRSGPVDAFGFACETKGKRKAGEALGLIPVLGSLAMAIGYTVVMGWIFRYMIGTFTGKTLSAVSVEDFAGAFESMASAFGNNFWQIVALVVAMVILAFGVGKGIEKVNKVLMPVFFLLFVALGIYVAFHIKKRLVREHYSVDTCGDGEEALDYMEMTSYDGVLLDIMLPGKDGFAVLKEVRQMGNNTPILLLTARDGIEDRVKGLDLGADDYLIKPFAFEELLARIRVMMRRKPQFVTNQLKIADLTLDRDTRIVKRAGKEISLSSKEFMVLECLMRNQNIVMTRQQIEQNAWNYDYEGGSNVIDVYIRYLRKKIDAGYEKKLIHTVRGTGYVMREE